MGSITRLGVLLESCDLVRSGIPKHDADGKAGVLDRVGDNRSPKMENLNPGGSEEKLDPRIITQSPSNAELSGTRRGCRWGIGRGGAGSGTRGGTGRAVIGRSGTAWRRSVIVAVSVVAIVAVIIAIAQVGVGIRLGRRGRGAGRARFAIVTLLLLFGYAVVVRSMPGRQVVTLNGESEGLRGSKRAEEDSERGERKDV